MGETLPAIPGTTILDHARAACDESGLSCRNTARVFDEWRGMGAKPARTAIWQRRQWHSHSGLKLRNKYDCTPKWRAACCRCSQPVHSWHRLCECKRRCSCLVALKLSQYYCMQGPAPEYLNSPGCNTSILTYRLRKHGFMFMTPQPGSFDGVLGAVSVQ